MRQPFFVFNSDNPGFVRILCLLSATLLVFIINGCDETDSNSPSGIYSGAMEIQSVETPPIWVFNSSHYHDLTVTLALPENVKDDILNGVTEKPVVLAKITPINQEQEEDIIVQLFDDGSNIFRENESNYCHQNSGDIISGDLVYNIQINSLFTVFEDSFKVTYAAGDVFNYGYSEEDFIFDPSLRQVDFYHEVDDGLRVGIIDLTPDSIRSNIHPYWQYQSDSFREIQVSVYLKDFIKEFINNGEVKPPDVTLTIFSQDNTNSDSMRVCLKDDGNQEPFQDSPQYMNSNSGDNLENDFIYTANINSLFADSEGIYKVITAVGDLTGTRYEFSCDGTNLNTPTDNYILENQELEVKENREPYFTGAELPSQLLSGFEPIIATTAIEDDDFLYGDYIDSVRMDIYNGDGVLKSVYFNQDDQVNWSYELRPEFSAGITTDIYDIVLNAWDRFAAPTMNPVDAIIYIENTAPVQTNLVAPDTTERPLDQDNEYFFYIDVNDLQGLAEIDTVRYEVKQPLGNRFIYNSEWILLDDGEGPDEIANDGTFSAGFVTRPENDSFGTYIFRFLSQDLVGNVSEPIDKEIEFIDYQGN